MHSREIMHHSITLNKHYARLPAKERLPLLNFLNLINVAGLVVTAASNIVLYPAEVIFLPASREGVAVIEAHREGTRADGKGKCVFKGVAVLFVQDWDQVHLNGDALEEIVHKAN